MSTLGIVLISIGVACVCAFALGCFIGHFIARGQGKCRCPRCSELAEQERRELSP